MSKKTIFLLLITLFFSPQIASSQDSIFVRQIIRDLSSKEMFGRGYAYKGDAIAANYICSLLQTMNAQPLTNEYKQFYGFYTFAMEGELSFKLNNKELKPYDDYRIAPFSNSLNGKFTLQKITPAFFDDPAYLVKLNHKNKKSPQEQILYLDLSHPKWNKKKNKTVVRQITERLNTSSTLGGYSAILVRTAAMPAWTFSGTGKQRDFSLLYATPQTVRYAPKDTLSVSFKNRYTFHKTQNIYALVEGTAVPDSFFVFTAHYDHLGMMGDSLYFPGAHDNASGVAFLLDLVRHYKQNPPAYSIIFIFLSGEEAGLKGSLFAVKNPIFDFDKVKLLLNLDMQCGGDEGIMVVNAQSEQTKPYYDQMVAYNQQNQLVTEVKSRANAPNSDHYPFSAFMPAIFIYTLGGKYGPYHHYDDTCERCALNNYNAIFQLLTRAIIQ